jgi:hypothetical protein
MATATPVYQIKGSYFIQAKQWIDEKLGEGSFRRLMVEAGAQRADTLLPGTWYDVLPLAQALAKASAQLKMPMEDLSTDIARRTAKNDLTTLYKIFLRVAAPQRVLSALPRLWATYVEFGEARILSNDPGLFVGEGVGFPAAVLDWACGCFRGFLPTAVEIAGGKDAVCKILERRPEAKDQYAIRFEVRYRK